MGTTAGTARSRITPSVSEALADACILVVDDNPANVTLLERLLQRAGARQVVGLTDPREVLDHFRRLLPDLILLDLHMPHIDGLGILHALHEVIPPSSYVPVLVLTADSTGAAKEQALSAGAKDFVTKPFDHSEVLLRVKNLLETRALHLALQRHNAVLEAQVRESEARERATAEARRRQIEGFRAVLDRRAITMVFQPIVELSTMRSVGVEALARFSSTPVRSPDQLFAEAASVGLGVDLELLAVEAALARIDQLPAYAYMSVNLSPGAVIDERTATVLQSVANRAVVEITEHAVVDDYDRLARSLNQLRSSGVRVAVDDAGSGYASLQHILRVQPDIIKLDIALTRSLHDDPARRALAGALVTFAAEIGASITAEGIEADDELRALRDLGVECGQGYHLGRPAPLDRP